MKEKRQKLLEAAGFQIGDAGDFLGLSVEERALVDLRVAVSQAVHLRRKKKKLTQVMAAQLLNSSQSRVAKIESGASDVTLDLMFRSLFALGGTVEDVLVTQSKLPHVKHNEKARASH